MFSSEVMVMDVLQFKSVVLISIMQCINPILFGKSRTWITMSGLVPTFRDLAAYWADKSKITCDILGQTLLILLKLHPFPLISKDRVTASKMVIFAYLRVFIIVSLFQEYHPVSTTLSSFNALHRILSIRKTSFTYSYIICLFSRHFLNSNLWADLWQGIGIFLKLKNTHFMFFWSSRFSFTS